MYQESDFSMRYMVKGPEAQQWTSFAIPSTQKSLGWNRIVRAVAFSLIVRNLFTDKSCKVTTISHRRVIEGRKHYFQSSAIRKLPIRNGYFGTKQIATVEPVEQTKVYRKAKFVK